MKKQGCSKWEIRKEGAKWISNAICKSGGSTGTYQMTREFNGEKAYRDENTETYDPPLRWRSRTHRITDGKWLGSC